MRTLAITQNITEVARPRLVDTKSFRRGIAYAAYAAA
jgi:hypothetical protein